MKRRQRSDSHLDIKMTNFEKAAASFLSILAVGLIGAVIWIYQMKWQQPLGPALQIPTVTLMWRSSTQTPGANAALLSTPWPSAVSPTLSAAVTSPTGQCGAPSVMSILAIGSDQRGDEYKYGLADAIRLIRIDTVTPMVTVLEFPRDLWVEIPDIADNLNGQDHEKLNQAYLYGNSGFGYTDDPAHGPGLLARTLALNFGTRIDHYAAVNMRTFVKIVDAVGGIDVNLPESVDGRTAEDTSSRLLFPKGDNHLDGPRALTLARIRIEGTFARGDNQNVVLCALRKKLTSPSVLSSIPDLIKSFQGAVQTDLSPAQLGQLACIGTQLQPTNIIFASFPETLFTQDRMYDPVFGKSIFVWNADYDVLRDYVGQFNDGTWPTAITVVQTHDEKGAAQLCQ
jgi:LCP family protein required for cell wall assembly